MMDAPSSEGHVGSPFLSGRKLLSTASPMSIGLQAFAYWSHTSGQEVKYRIGKCGALVSRMPFCRSPSNSFQGKRIGWQTTDQEKTTTKTHYVAWMPRKSGVCLSKRSWLRSHRAQVPLYSVVSFLALYKALGPQAQNTPSPLTRH